MNFNKREQDLEKVFNQRWKANNYNQNGMKEKVEHNKDTVNKMFNIKSASDQKKEILHANSINGRIENLEKNMRSASAMMKHNNFK